MSFREMNSLIGAYKYFGIVLLCLFFFGHAVVLAQVTTATIAGSVRDQTGAVVPGVSVTARNLNTGLSRTVVTNERGRYQIPSLPPGSYEVQGELAGFQRAIRRGIELTVGREAIVDLGLQVGEVAAEVVVTGEAPLVENTRAELAGLVTGSQIASLPLNGRSLDQLVHLEPGIVPTRTNIVHLNVGFATHIQSGGARQDANVFLLDGTDANDFVGATPGSVTGNFLGADTIREFKVLRHNYSAEYGRAAGSVIASVTRSGTNALHGSAFWFHRNDNLDARNFFDALEGPPEFKRNQYGFSIGGPIRRDKTFFFGSYEGLRERLGQSLRSFFPNQTTRNGFLPNPTTAVLEPVAIDPRSKRYLDLLPLPNGRDFGDGTGEFLFGFSQPTDEDFFVAKIDHQFSDTHTLFGRYTFDEASVISARPHPSFNQGLGYRGQYLTLENTNTLSPRLINVVHLGFTRTRPVQFSGALVSFDPSLSFVPGQPIGNITFTTSVVGLGAVSEFGPFGNITSRETPQVNLQNMFQVGDSVTFISGRHSYKFGFSFQRFQHNVFGNITRYGQWQFPSLRNFLTATPARFTAETPQSDPGRGWRQNLFGFYAQDDLQLGQNFTLNLGVRWEFTTVPTEVNGKIANLLDPIHDVLPTKGVLWESNVGNVAPRIGLSWDPWGDGRSSVRAGLGVYHNQMIGRSWERFARQADPSQITVQVNNPQFFPTAPSSLFENVSGATTRFTTLAPDMSVPTMLHWNLTVEREVAQGTVVSLAYVGSHGYHLRLLREGNAVLPVLQEGRKFYPAGSRRRNPALDQIQLFTTDANSNYNSFQLSVKRRFQSGLQFQASYTFSRSIDDISSVAAGESQNGGRNTPQDPDDRISDRGLSNFDVRNRATINFIYKIPSPAGQGFLRHLFGGWSTSNIITLSDGLPLNINLSFGRSRSLVLSDRPDLAPGRSNNPVLGGADQYYDPTAFVLQPLGYNGNLGRNTAIGPGLATWDFSLVKSMPLGEEREIQFKSEFFNILNRANFGIPNLSVFNSDGSRIGQAGRITNTITSSRQIQFGLKFIF